MRRVLIAGAALAFILAASAFLFRRWVVLGLFALFIVDGRLLDPIDEGPGVEWFDDYYTIEVLDPGTIAIGEPRFSQQNYNYLIVGTERAVLFDSGPGVRDIRAVVAQLTDLPVMAVPSHLHYDHIGRYQDFDSVGIVDLPYLRERAAGNVLRPTVGEHLGFIEGIARPSIRVTEWLAPESDLELGGRTLRVIRTPGHTPESISLYDAERRQLFTGDYITQGGLLAFAPGSSLPDYLRTANALIERIPKDTTLLGAHRATPPAAPIVPYQDLADLRDALREIREGRLPSESFYPRVFRVNVGLVIYSDLPSLERWD